MSTYYRNMKKLEKISDITGTASRLKRQDYEGNIDASVDVPKLKFSKRSIDDNLPGTVTLLRTPDGGKCYVIGTVHFSIESQNDVSKIIQAVQPHRVVIELCKDRLQILYDGMGIEKDINFNFNTIVNIIKENGIMKGLLIILSCKLPSIKLNDLESGGEFRRALSEVKKLPKCFINLGDRPFKITFARALSRLTWWQTIKLAWEFITLSLTKNNLKISKKYRSRNFVEEQMTQFTIEYPALQEILVKERDIYLTHSLQLACKPIYMERCGEMIPARVVGIVGIGHMLGIIENWGKVKSSQIPPIMSIPPLSFSTKMLITTIKTCFVGTAFYATYKFIRLVITMTSFLLVIGR